MVFGSGLCCCIRARRRVDLGFNTRVAGCACTDVGVGVDTGSGVRTGVIARVGRGAGRESPSNSDHAEP